ncbi:hypothetical protein H257_10796 [Aphanomyces astaci]|uniref:ISXO2-like transposase domain-containing protein n=1 Tax=Aphanomyces astaci TaxID=112090 RepID=W4G4N9_APHAT|nr:hypothetical protein H257_10796 [Aphanomyces astaci]ETV74672.1 hypothetical protein H257_10796 [Aphanomyces astaci]|eukprot:XP_009835759.1 hypothetical protein H257_10796 [Aphanomyces astaci]
MAENDAHGPPLDQVPADAVRAEVELYDMSDVADFSWHSDLKATGDECTCKRWRCRRRAYDGLGNVEIGVRTEEMPMETGVDWYNYCRELCSMEMLRTPMMFGQARVVRASNEQHTLANNPLLADQGYSHEWVNHTENFVNPVNGGHTQSIEGAWEIRIKRFSKAMRGMHRPHLPSYLDEYLWRSTMRRCNNTC